LDSYDVRLLDTTYTIVSKQSTAKEKENVIVKLFGKTRDNRSITILCPDFKPYCHVFMPTAEVKDLLLQHNSVLKVEDVTLEYKGVREPFAKVTLRAPYMMYGLKKEFDTEHTVIRCSPSPDVLRQIEREPEVKVSFDDGETIIMTGDRTLSQKLVQKYDLLKCIPDRDKDRWLRRATFFAADILFTNRYIYDMDLETCITVRGVTLKNRTEHTTDLVVVAKEFDKCPVFTPKLKIMSFDIESSIKYKNLYCICISQYDQATDQWENVEIVSQHGVRIPNPTPEQKEAWADDEKRMLQEFINTVRRLDPDVITGYNINNFDLQELFRAGIRHYGKGMPKREQLEAMNIGRDAQGLSRRTMKNQKGGDGGYMWDAKGRLILDAWIFVKKELRPKREQLGFVANQLFNDTKDNIDSAKIDSEWEKRKPEVVKYCLKDAQLAAKVLMHPKINTTNKVMDVAIPSKLPVKDVAGGQGKMIESVLIRMVDRRGIAVPCGSGDKYEYEGAYVVDSIPGLWDWVIGLDFSSMYPSQIIKHNICFTTYDSTDRAGGDRSPDYLIDKVVTMHASFVPKSVRHGIIPEMVDGFIRSRKEAKALKKKYEQEGNKDMAEYYDRLQNAIKVLANATYGYFGTAHCRWPYKRMIAPTITAWGREEILTVKKLLEERGCTVVAGDTDSVMFTHPEHRDVESCKTLGLEVTGMFSKGNMNLELEKVMKRFFTHAKKRYYGDIVWPKQEPIIRGYELRRTDSFDLLTKTQDKMFKMMMTDGKPEDVVKFCKETVSSAKKGNVEFNDVVISKGVKAEDDYSNPDGQIQVRVVRKMQERGYEFTPGMKYSYVVTCASPLDAEPVIEGVEFTYKPDYSYYAFRLAKALAKVTGVFGCSEKMLLQGVEQRSLFSFDDDKNGRPLSLADFM
jgi:DNA polymerase I